MLSLGNRVLVKSIKQTGVVRRIRVDDDSQHIYTVYLDPPTKARPDATEDGMYIARDFELEVQP